MTFGQGFLFQVLVKHQIHPNTMCKRLSINSRSSSSEGNMETFSLKADQALPIRSHCFNKSWPQSGMTKKNRMLPTVLERLNQRVERGIQMIQDVWGHSFKAHYRHKHTPVRWFGMVWDHISSCNFNVAIPKFTWYFWKVRPSFPKTLLLYIHQQNWRSQISIFQFARPRNASQLPPAPAARCTPHSTWRTRLSRAIPWPPSRRRACAEAKLAWLFPQLSGGMQIFKATLTSIEQIFSKQISKL